MIFFFVEADGFMVIHFVGMGGKSGRGPGFASVENFEDEEVSFGKFEKGVVLEPGKAFGGFLAKCCEIGFFLLSEGLTHFLVKSAVFFVFEEARTLEAEAEDIVIKGSSFFVGVFGEGI